MVVVALVAAIGVAVVSGYFASKIASAKGHSGEMYFLVGFLLPVIGILAAGIMPPNEQRLQRQKESHETALRMVELRSKHDADATDFLITYEAALTNALFLCEVGERVLAYGRGVWQDHAVGVFVLTDQRLAFVGVSRATSFAVTDFDGTVCNPDEDEISLPDGSLRLDGPNPYTASEIVDLVDRRHTPERSVEIVAPGELSVARSPYAETPPEPPAPRTDLVSEIERLDALHQSGAIDDDEFAELKRQLVWGEDGPTESNG